MELIVMLYYHCQLSFLCTIISIYCCYAELCWIYHYFQI